MFTTEIDEVTPDMVRLRTIASNDEVIEALDSEMWSHILLPCYNPDMKILVINEVMSRRLSYLGRIPAKDEETLKALAAATFEDLDYVKGLADDDAIYLYFIRKPAND